MFYQKFQQKLERACGSCSLCCEGHFYLECEGEVYQIVDHPCKYLSSDEKICTIYSKRPKCCHTYNCLYKQDVSVPEWLKPDKSKFIFTVRKRHGVTYIEVKQAGGEFSDNIVKWIIDRLNEKHESFVIEYQDKVYLLQNDLVTFNQIKDMFQSKYQTGIEDAKKLHFLSKYFDNNANENQ